MSYRLRRPSRSAPWLILWHWNVRKIGHKGKWQMTLERRGKNPKNITKCSYYRNIRLLDIKKIMHHNNRPNKKNPYNHLNRSKKKSIWQNSIPTHATTTQQTRSRAVSSVWQSCVSGRPAANSPLDDMLSALPEEGPIRQGAHLFLQFPLVQEQSGNKVKTRKTGKEEIKLALLTDDRWCM